MPTPHVAGAEPIPERRPAGGTTLTVNLGFWLPWPVVLADLRMRTFIGTAVDRAYQDTDSTATGLDRHRDVRVICLCAGRVVPGRTFSVWTRGSSGGFGLVRRQQCCGGPVDSLVPSTTELWFASDDRPLSNVPIIYGLSACRVIVGNLGCGHTWNEDEI